MDDLKTILKEMRAYNPKADEHGGKFIIPGWADRIEKALTIQLPDVLDDKYSGSAPCMDDFDPGLYMTDLTKILTAAGITVKSD